MDQLAESCSASASPGSCPMTCSTWRRRRDESGKPPGTDLQQGVRTLPVLYALRSRDPSDEPGCARCFRSAS